MTITRREINKIEQAFESKQNVLVDLEGYVRLANEIEEDEYIPLAINFNLERHTSLELFVSDIQDCIDALEAEIYRRVNR